MTGPKRIQMSRQRPWRPEHPDAVIVARPSKWGNPFAIGAAQNAMKYDMRPSEMRQWAVDMYAKHFADDDLDVTELTGRDLACWCLLDQPCHGDWLLAKANPELAAARMSPPTTAKEA